MDQIRKYYENNKYIFEITGFVAVITGLFLQVNIQNSESLKMLQFFLLAVLTILLIVIFIKIWSEMQKKAAADIRVSATMLVISSIIVTFVVNLIVFIIETFSKEFYRYFNLTAPYLPFLVFAISWLVAEKISKRHGKQKLLVVIVEVIFIFSMIFFSYVIPRNVLFNNSVIHHFTLFTISCYILVGIILILEKLNLIRERISLPLIFTVFICYLILIKLNL